MSLALPLSTSGRFIVDAHGRRVRLAGVNWAGASEDMGVPVGLDQVNDAGDDKRTDQDLAVAAQGCSHAPTLARAPAAPG